MSVKSKKYDGLQVLRAVAAISVLIWHSPLAITYFPDSYWHPNNHVWNAATYPFFLNHLYSGVDLFFCISGFIISESFMAPGMTAREFILRRVFRIFPIYWFFTALLVGAFYFNSRWNFGSLTGDFMADFMRILKSILLVPQPTSPIIGPGWTLVHEMIFYYICFVLLFLGFIRKLPIVLGAILLISVVFFYWRIDPFYDYLFTRYQLEFLVGVLAWRHRAKLAGLFSCWAVPLALTSYLVTCWLLDQAADSRYFGSIQVTGFSICSILLFSAALAPIKTGRISQAMVSIGDASYTLYLSHYYVLVVLGKIGSFLIGINHWGIIAWHCFSIAMVLAFAVMFSRMIEMPLHRKLVAVAKKLAPRA